jgi:hypothetical protein
MTNQPITTPIQALTGMAPHVAGSVAICDGWYRALQAIAAEMGDYSQRTLQEGTSVMTEMAQATSPTEAMGVQAAFAKRMMQEHVEQMTRIMSMYASAADDTGRALQAMVLLPVRRD